jgi:HSP20 family protein
MTLVRWQPTRELGTLQREMDRLFGSVFSVPTAAVARRRWIPSMDLVASGDEYVLSADLPGLSAEDVKVEIDDNVLTVSGERVHSVEKDGEGYRRVERATGSFARSLTLPSGTDATAITARLSDGVLEVHIPRPEQRQPLSVAIETGSEPVGSEENAPAEAPAAA